MDKLKKIFISVLGIDATAVTPELSPENTPTWDSMNAIILIVEIEKAFNVKFEYAEAMAVKNFGDVVTLVKSKAPDFPEA
jgi:acyl carrier protein